MRRKAKSCSVEGKYFWERHSWGFYHIEQDLNTKEKKKQTISNAEDECIIKQSSQNQRTENQTNKQDGQTIHCDGWSQRSGCCLIKLIIQKQVRYQLLKLWYITEPLCSRPLLHKVKNNGPRGKQVGTQNRKEDILEEKEPKQLSHRLFLCYSRADPLVEHYRSNKATDCRTSSRPSEKWRKLIINLLFNKCSVTTGNNSKLMLTNCGIQRMLMAHVLSLRTDDRK